MMKEIDVSDCMWHEPSEMAEFRQTLVKYNETTVRIIDAAKARIPQKDEEVVIMQFLVLSMQELYRLNSRIQADIIDPVPDVRYVKGAIEFYNHKLVMLEAFIEDSVEDLGIDLS